MASWWNELKNALSNAGSAAQNVDKQAISTAQNTAKKQDTAVTNPTPTTQKSYTEMQHERLNQPYKAGTTPTVNQIVQNYSGSNAGGNTGGNAGSGGGGGNSGSGSGGNDAIYNAYAQAVARQDALYKQQEALMSQQYESLKNKLHEQTEAAKRNRQMLLDNTLEANNKAAEDAMREAYTAYMFNKMNMPQLLKASGVSGGASESTVLGMNSNYENNRRLIDHDRNYLNASARNQFDMGVNDDYINYLSALADVESNYADRLYNLYAQQGNNLASTLSSAVKSSGGSSSSGSKNTTNAVSGYTNSAVNSAQNNANGGNNGYAVMQVKLGNNTYSVPQLINTLVAQGMSDSQIEAFLNAQGIR